MRKAGLQRLCCALLIFSGSCTPDSPSAPAQRSQAEPPKPEPVAAPANEPLAPCPEGPTAVEPAFKAIVSAYGPIEGEVARLAESRALARLFAHGEVERVERHLGEGVKRWTIVERRVHGVPVEIRGRARLYEDPIAEVPAGGIVAIVFGQSPNEGLHITEPRDIGAIERALRCSSYSVPELVENRPYRRRNGRLAEIPPLGDQLFVAETHLCSQGLWLHLIGGKVVNVDGHADMDHVSGYEDNEPLETAMLAAIERLRRERKRSAPPHRKSPGGDRAPR